MGMEREIKLALPVSQVKAATQWFVARTGNQGRPIELANIYFDTPKLALASSKSALRLRHTPDGWLQTFKTVGDAIGSDQFGFIFKPGSDLVAPVNAALAAMKVDGTIEALNKKWFFDYGAAH